MLIRREIQLRIRSILIWSAVFAFFIIGGATKFSVFENGNGMELNQFVQSMPRLMRVVYGMEGVDIGTFTGYFSILLLYVLIMVAVQGAFLGASLIHLEFRERTADFLFVKPLSRTRILLGKLTGGLGVILLLEIAVAVCSWYVFQGNGKLDLLPRTLLAILSTHLFYYALGFLLTILLPRTKTGQQVSLVYLLMSYLAISFSQLFDRPELAYISPVGWFERNLYSADPAAVTAVTLLVAALALVFVILALIRFRSKDIPS